MPKAPGPRTSIAPESRAAVVMLGGAIYEATGSYDGMWMAGIALGLASALIHLPIDERPLPRLAEG